MRQLFEPLLRFDENLIPRPAAAESFEVSPDGSVVTFHLRRDGYWSDGQPVIAAHFAYSWKRLLDPALHADYTRLFVDAGIAGITALDDYTLEIRLNQPFGALPNLAALWVAAPLRADIVDQDPDGWATDTSTLIGNGPFMLADWVHQDHLTLVPNPFYVAHFNWPKPLLTTATIFMGTNGEADLADFKSGSRDWMLVRDIDVNQVLNDPDLSRQSRQYNELSTFWVQLNNTRPPLDNVLVRRAYAKAIDRAALVRDLAVGVSQPATSIIPPGMPGFDANLGHDLAFDATGARGLLTQAGVSPRLTFTYPDSAANHRRARWLQAEWNANLGVDVQLSALSAQAYQDALASRSYDMAFGGWAADYPDPQDWFSMLFDCKAAYNQFGYCNAAFDQLVARADVGFSMDERLALYGQAQSLLMQDVPVIPLFARGRVALVKPWVTTQDGSPLSLSPLDDYPGSLFLDKVQILPH